jgi:hypothetical protein
VIKKVRDCNFEELKLFCDTHTLCRQCPFKDDVSCKISNITNLPEDTLNIEIDLMRDAKWASSYSKDRLGYVDEDDCFLNHMEEVLTSHSK